MLSKTDEKVGFVIDQDTICGDVIQNYFKSVFEGYGGYLFKTTKETKGVSEK